MSALPTRADISGTPNNAVAKAALTGIYDMIAQRLAAGTSGAGTATSAELNLARESLQMPHRNYVDNPIGPSGVVYQRTVAAMADGAYFADRYYSLSQTGTVTPSIITAPETGFKQGLRITQSQVSAQRYGFAQILPEDYVTELAGGNVSMSLRARISNTTTLRFALLAWTGTADTVTRDVVNDWTSATFTTGNFFITGGGSYTVIATGSQAMTAATFATLSLAGQAVGSTAKNLVLVCWTDSTQAQNTTLDWHDVRLTKTDVVTPVINRSIGEENHIAVLWYVNHINGVGLGTQGFLSQSNATAAGLIYQVVTFPRPMYRTPTTNTKLGTWAVSNCGQPSINGVTRSGFYFSSMVTAGGGAQTTSGAANAGYENSCDL